MAAHGLSWRRLRPLAFVAFALIASAGAAVASSTSVDFGDISHKGLKDLGPASTGLKLSLELGLIANQQGHRERREGGEQSLLVELRPVPLAVDAAEEVRRHVVPAQRGRRRVQDLRRDRDGGRDAPARQRDDQHRERAEAVRHEVGSVRDRASPTRPWRCRSNTPKLGSGLAGNVDTVSGLGLYVTSTCPAARRCRARGRPGRLRSTAGRPPAPARSTRAARPRPTPRP